MIFRFKSKAAADLIMLGTHAEQILHALGKEPAAQGIIESVDLPAAIGALESALATVERDEDKNTGSQQHDAVSLRQRAWPLLQMMHRAHAANVDIVWET